jgi:lysozyme
MKNGIDVSEFNGTIDWPKVKAAGIDMVWVKASLGATYTDPRYITNTVMARAAGVKVGHYHFATLNSQNVAADATTEANFFISKLKQVPFDLPPVLDLEENKANLKPEQVKEWVITFQTVLDMWLKANNHQLSTILYSYMPFLNDLLPGGVDMHLWLAQYNSKPAPIRPKGWATDTEHRKLIAWQWSNQGKIDGIKGDVDLNRVFE